MKSTPLITAAILSALTRAGPATAQVDEDPILTLNDDNSFNFDILTGLGQTVNDGADVGPVLEAAKRIVPGDWDSYTEVWFDIANRTKAEALDLELAYDPVNVRAAWFSVSNYFRRADVYNRADWDDPRINDYWDEQTAAFDRAIAALPVPAKRLQIPADNFTVEAIWYPQHHESNYTRRLPTLIIVQGFDAAQEDLYSTIAAPALARGWNVLSLEGPGQPKVRRDQGLGFIPDWERVVTPAVDYLLSDKNASVDPERLALFGNSLGGYLGARAAAFEPRLSALMLDGGVWNLYDGYARFLSTGLVELLESGQKEAFDKAARQLQDDPEASTNVKWGILQGLWAFKTNSPYEFLQATKKYTLKGGIADKIQMPVWIADGEYETTLPGQSQLVKDALGDRAELHIFNGSAGYHCQTGAPQELSRVLFAWLDKTLNKA
ncbi:hypothetical protein FDECE_6853 [Fusarium decemcellulare]|nr:hypothetical protein FDECE_6853 [Fusarium decemcellulare]